MDSEAKFDLLSISWPLFLDQFLRMIVVVFFYWIVSRISDDMAAIVGITNACLLIGFSLAESLAQGGAILLAQFLGAGVEKPLKNAYGTTLWINGVSGLVISALLIEFSHSILIHFGFSDTALIHGTRYLNIVSLGFVIFSLNYALMSILNANRLTRHSMINSFIVNGLSIILGFSVVSIVPGDSLLRLTLLACSQVVSRLIGFAFLALSAKRVVPHFVFFSRISWKDIREHLRLFVRIAIPNSLEPFSYHFFQIVLLKLIAIIGISALSTRSYIIALANLLETGAYALSKGNQILMGHLIGAQKFEKARDQLCKGIKWTLLISLILIIIGLLCRNALISLFSRNVEIIETGKELLFLVSLVTLLKAYSFNYSAALRSAGDVRFGVIIVTLTMWGGTVPLAYFLVTTFHCELKGIWILFALEEIARIFIFSRRWKNEKWKNIKLVTYE